MGSWKLGFFICPWSSPLLSTTKMPSWSWKQEYMLSRVRCGTWRPSSIRHWSYLYWWRMQICSSMWCTRREFWPNTQSTTSRSPICWSNRRRPIRWVSSTRTRQSEPSSTKSTGSSLIQRPDGWSLLVKLLYELL